MQRDVVEHKQLVTKRTEVEVDESPIMRALAESQTRGTFQDAYHSPNSSMNSGNSKWDFDV